MFELGLFDAFEVGAMGGAHSSMIVRVPRELVRAERIVEGEM